MMSRVVADALPDQHSGANPDGHGQESRRASGKHVHQGIMMRTEAMTHGTSRLMSDQYAIP